MAAKRVKAVMCVAGRKGRVAKEEAQRSRAVAKSEYYISSVGYKIWRGSLDTPRRMLLTLRITLFVERLIPRMESCA